MIVKRVYNTTPGADFIAVPELAFVTVLKVKREGLGYDVTTASTFPGNRQVRHQVSSGILTFLVPFNDVGGGIGEPIYVLFKS